VKVKGGFDSNGTVARSKKSLSSCAVCYARSLVDPFDGPAACIPDFPVMLSRRAKFFCKGFFSTGTTGLGFIVACPEYGAVNDTPLGGGACVRVSDLTNTLTTIALNSPTGNNPAFTNSDYTGASFGVNAVLSEYRVVSAGIRVRYFSTELQMGGGYVALQEPNHQTVLNQTVAALKGYTECKTFPIKDDRPWIHVLFKPVLNNDSTYKDTFPAMTGTLADFNYYMVIAVIAPDPTQPLVFEWEFFGNYEFSGRNIQGKVISQFDPVGYGAVCSATAESQAFKPSLSASNNDQMSFVNDVARAATLSSGF
jgi:hypothetical protein